MKKIVPPKAHLIPDGATKVFGGKIFDIYQWQQKMFDGSEETFEMLKRPDTANVICVKDGKIIVLKQSQPNSPGEFLGFPGGRSDEGESPLTAAKREVLEEIGMTFKTWKLLDVVQPLQKIEWFIYTYLATDFETETDTHHDSGEKIEMQSMSFEEVLENADGEARLDMGPVTNYSSLQELLDAPEFDGQEVDR